MATPAMNPPSAAPEQGAAPASPAAKPLQILAAITRLAQMMSQMSPATAPMAEEITRQVQQAMSKLIGSQPGEPSQPTPF